MMSTQPAVFSHEPVMVREITELFANVPDGVVLDATLGGAGHTTAILDAHPGLRVLGLDRDPAALEASRVRLAPYGDRAMLQHRRFDDLDAAMSEAGITELSGALFDLGVSSHQFDSGERGFSYRHDAPLDMRMDTTESTTAADVVNQASEGEIAHLLREYSDEKFAGRIARAIIAARPIHTTAELADVVASAIPAPARRRGGHPAKRTFQALRISLNKELEILPNAIDSAVRRTRIGGRVAVLSYHSGEDRIIKARFKQHATGGCECPSTLPCGCGATRIVRLVRVASKPNAEEQLSNPRSSSARLRVAEVL
ncbi:MAG: 16S rRNA (cytosine(1402)-N(4))-methyltransferase RsmH [Actinobacteria bacterium]|nr:16S rRNA (cytosine(1402)-N(4))-methyltransferase RsmH [Actinomycetota bacterium]MSX14751.1 16S rRNA (cytosine(1402)-N(4))-methyltransferase RsmH [Actinomycetota bacterium]MSX35560.1 16S rRNA (cytosine(1402)-N(4))-methyltransferase RsmH [Actinomycetota bacterium]MSX76489.1 16S rRNA (cytosine(1402)-N(4))-methyltransferase RsmH [Actinomycetota bacterium]MSZ70853.1 16S rRNA (cytosine(1402)-N(4))-methyltransferase RsmH [Actinomycetota bacterium]